MNTKIKICSCLLILLMNFYGNGLSAHPVENVKFILSQVDQNVIQNDFHLDLKNITCEKFTKLYLQERIGYITTFFGGMAIPGLGQFQRKEYTKGFVYSLSLLAYPLQYFFWLPFIHYVPEVIKVLSLYEAKNSNRFLDQRFFDPKKNNLSKLLFNSINFQALTKKDTYKWFGLGLLAKLTISVPLVLLFGKIFSSAIDPHSTAFIKTKSIPFHWIILDVVGHSYLAAVFEEMLFRATIMPLFEEDLLRKELFPKNELLKRECPIITIADIMDKLETLPDQKQKELRTSAKNKANIAQAILFAAAHGNPLASSHIIGGLIMGFQGSESSSYEIEKAVVYHFWYDILMISLKHLD